MLLQRVRYNVNAHVCVCLCVCRLILRHNIRNEPRILPGSILRDPEPFPREIINRQKHIDEVFIPRTLL